MRFLISFLSSKLIGCVAYSLSVLCFASQFFYAHMLLLVNKSAKKYFLSSEAYMSTGGSLAKWILLGAAGLFVIVNFWFWMRRRAGCKVCIFNLCLSVQMFVILNYCVLLEFFGHLPL